MPDQKKIKMFGVSGDTLAGLVTKGYHDYFIDKGIPVDAELQDVEYDTNAKMIWLTVSHWSFPSRGDGDPISRVWVTPGSSLKAADEVGRYGACSIKILDHK